MAQFDWTFLKDGLDINAVDRGVTAGIPRAPGGGAFLYGFNTLTVAAGSVALFANIDDFAPMAKGGSIRACIQRGCDKLAGTIGRCGQRIVTTAADEGEAARSSELDHGLRVG